MWTEKVESKKGNQSNTLKREKKKHMVLISPASKIFMESVYIHQPVCGM